MCEDTMATNISVIQWSNYNDRSQGTQPRSLIRTDHWMNWVIFSRVWPADPFLLSTCICLAPDPSLTCTQSPSSILRLNIHCHVHIWCLKMMDCDSLKPYIKSGWIHSSFYFPFVLSTLLFTKKAHFDSLMHTMHKNGKYFKIWPALIWLAGFSRYFW